MACLTIQRLLRTGMRAEISLPELEAVGLYHLSWCPDCSPHGSKRLERWVSKETFPEILHRALLAQRALIHARTRAAYTKLEALYGSWRYDWPEPLDEAGEPPEWAGIHLCDAARRLLRDGIGACLELNELDALFCDHAACYGCGPTQIDLVDTVNSLLSSRIRGLVTQETYASSRGRAAVRELKLARVARQHLRDFFGDWPDEEPPPSAER